MHVEVLTAVLKNAGYSQVRSTTDSRAALRLVGELRPDLVILDLHMPGIGGLQVLEQIRAAEPDAGRLPILVVTADPSIEARRQALALGASDFIIKPYDGSEILARAGNLLEAHFLHRELARQNADLAQEMRRRAEAEETLRFERDDLRDFLENAAVGLHWVGEDGTILWANQAELDLLGYTREEYIGRPIAEFHADAGTIEDIFTRLLNKETLHSREARLRCKDGSIRHVVISSNVLWRDGKFVRTRCFTRDITERKRAEAALQASEERLRTLLEVLPAAAYTCDTDGLITYFNPRAAELWGRSPRLHHPEDRFCGSLRLRLADGTRISHQECWMARTLKEGRAMSGHEIVVERDDGSERFALAYANPLRDASGKLIGAVNVLVDITEHRETAAALRECDARYRRIAANAPGMVYQFLRRPDGSIAFPSVGGGSRELFGLEPETLQADARVLVGFIHPGDLEGFARSVDASAETLAPWRWEGRFQLPSGEEKWIQGASRPERQGNGDILWDGLLMDITARKRTEATALLAREEAERANAAKSEFLSRMSHELRTPLNAILGFGQLLEMDACDPEEADNIRQILKAGRHLLGLVDELLALSISRPDTT